MGRTRRRRGAGGDHESTSWSEGMSGASPGSATTRHGGLKEGPIRPPPDPHTDRPLICFLGLGLVLGLAAGTQYVAWRFAFHPNLGAPLLVLHASTVRLLRAVGI